MLSDQEVCLHRHLLRPTSVPRYPGQSYQLGLKQLTTSFLLYAIYKAGWIYEYKISEYNSWAGKNVVSGVFGVYSFIYIEIKYV